MAWPGSRISSSRRTVRRLFASRFTASWATGGCSGTSSPAVSLSRQCRYFRSSNAAVPASRLRFAQTRPYAVAMDRSPGNRLLAIAFSGSPKPTRQQESQRDQRTRFAVGTEDDQAVGGIVNIQPLDLPEQMRAGQQHGEGKRPAGMFGEAGGQDQGEAHGVKTQHPSARGRAEQAGCGFDADQFVIGLVLQGIDGVVTQGPEEQA